MVAAEDVQRMRQEFRDSLRAALQAARAPAPPLAPSAATVKTAPRQIPGPGEESLRSIARQLLQVPKDFHLHPKLKRIIDDKSARFSREGGVDWALAESLAFGSLLKEGVHVRLSGQDSARGTFSQRHLVWWDTETSFPTPYIPLLGCAPDRKLFSVYDSPLSEYSILGFEYGYSQGAPAALVLWEAQFGDFSNGGQVIIDNYVAAGEAKWGTTSGIVLLLPHGFEGQGPEHSSAHIERFLLLCAQENIQVCNCSTPAQYFHLLRRQAKHGQRKPLAVMTPKSLLRHPKAASSIGELASGEFEEVLDDPNHPKNPERLLLCTGKVYYDLAAAREEQKNAKVEIVRIEQLFPFPEKALSRILENRGWPKDVRWVQEEPRNRGAWSFMRERFERSFGGVKLSYVGREESPSPATGSHSRHEREQKELVKAALAGGRDAFAGARAALAGGRAAIATKRPPKPRSGGKKPRRKK
jgi:2-oxoglutarate dehydrogenase E1 component